MTKTHAGLSGNHVEKAVSADGPSEQSVVEWLSRKVGIDIRGLYEKFVRQDRAHSTPDSGASDYIVPLQELLPGHKPDPKTHVLPKYRGKLKFEELEKR